MAAGDSLLNTRALQTHVTISALHLDSLLAFSLATAFSLGLASVPDPWSNNIQLCM